MNNEKTPKKKSNKKSKKKKKLNNSENKYPPSSSTDFDFDFGDSFSTPPKPSSSPSTPQNQNNTSPSPQPKTTPGKFFQSTGLLTFSFVKELPVDPTQPIFPCLFIHPKTFKSLECPSGSWMMASFESQPQPQPQIQTGPTNDQSITLTPKNPKISKNTQNLKVETLNYPIQVFSSNKVPNGKYAINSLFISSIDPTISDLPLPPIKLVLLSKFPFLSKNQIFVPSRMYVSINTTPSEYNQIKTDIPNIHPSTLSCILLSTCYNRAFFPGALFSVFINGVLCTLCAEYCIPNRSVWMCADTSSIALIKPKTKTTENSTFKSNTQSTKIPGGLEKQIKSIRQLIETPLIHPDRCKSLGISPPKGILMVGPPGTGKTMIAKYLASTLDMNFVVINGPSVVSKYVGESEKAVRSLFKKARAASPSIIFFDEIDSFTSSRFSSESNVVGDRVVAQLLNEMDGIESLKDVVIVAATNRRDAIDPALLRPGRLDLQIYVSLPNENAREKIFQISFQNMPIDPEVSITELVKMTDGMSGAQIVAICREAALTEIRNLGILGKSTTSETTVSFKSFQEAIQLQIQGK